MGATAVMTTTMDLTIRLRLARTQPVIAVLDVFERLVETFAIKPTNWSATSSGDEQRLGGLADLRTYIQENEPMIEFFSAVRNSRVASASGDKAKDAWNLDITVFHGDETWLRTAIDATREAASYPALIDAMVSRGSANSLEFAPSPPIAQGNYVVLTTEAQVAEAYDDPAVFWASWDNVEDVNGRKLCTRALRALADEYWLGETFEASMAMARAARPHLTQYPLIRLSGMEGPWWDFGDVQDEKAGWPMLDLVGYEPKTETVEFAAKPGHSGHVLLQEIDTIRQLVGRGKTRDKKPVKAVRVVFLDEATARVEKRPLLDVGAKVYYMGKETELVELTE